MNLVAVVLSWNGREDTLACLESLRGIETVFVDNGSSDGSADAVAERFPDVDLIRTEVNLGFAAGNNVGIRRALDRGADWVLLVNNDAHAEESLVPALEAAAEARPDAGVLACKVLFADSRKLWYAARPSIRSSDAAVTPASAAPARRAGCEDIVRATGTGMAVSRAAIERAGLLDEELLPLRGGSRVEPAHPRGGLRDRLRARGAGAPPRLGVQRRCRLADDELLRDEEHARRRRALPAAASRAVRPAARVGRHAAGRARTPAARLGVRGASAAGATIAAAGWGVG